MSVTLLIRLVIEGPSEDEAESMLEDMLDHGAVQDLVHEAFEDLHDDQTRVTAASVLVDNGDAQRAALERVAGPLRYHEEGEPVELAPLPDDVMERLLSKGEED